VIVTEEELREAWKNGRGALPEFPPGTRYTPAAKDFLASRAASSACAKPGIADAAVFGAGTERGDSPIRATMAGASTAARMDLRAEGGKRLILTTDDLDDILRAAPSEIVIHPSATVTDAARERLGKAGIRLLPFVEKRKIAAEDVAHNASSVSTAPRAALASAPAARSGSVAAATTERALCTVRAEESPQASKASRAASDELFLEAKKAVMQRLGARVDEAVVDAVLRRVISGL